MKSFVLDTNYLIRYRKELDKLGGKSGKFYLPVAVYEEISQFPTIFKTVKKLINDEKLTLISTTKTGIFQELCRIFKRNGKKNDLNDLRILAACVYIRRVKNEEVELLSFDKKLRQKFDRIFTNTN
jgi:hypothetical protein